MRIVQKGFRITLMNSDTSQIQPEEVAKLLSNRLFKRPSWGFRATTDNYSLSRRNLEDCEKCWTLAIRIQTSENRV
ncbi:hypothetical protein AYI69_g11230 [Smittium culicis]|uniref:Uncharacterized protein n=1 Tax=Smittium culicis TaxID=133412 RepID=A0A1R1X072_9FUNG|nr:hypothetical protein AYI69_g11230 [Smittium culicis]